MILYVKPVLDNLNNILNEFKMIFNNYLNIMDNNLCYNTYYDYVILFIIFSIGFIISFSTFNRVLNEYIYKIDIY